MNPNLYSNSEFQLLKKRLNKEMMRRATFRWWDPLVLPRVGQDRTPPLSLPVDQERVLVDNDTYTIQTPSTGSIEPVKNDQYPNRGDTLAGTPYDTTPTSSSSRVTVDEIKNFIVGLSKINDIQHYYGRDEKPGTAYRDPNPIQDLLSKAETDVLNTDLAASDLPNYRMDPTWESQISGLTIGPVKSWWNTTTGTMTRPAPMRILCRPGNWMAKRESRMRITSSTTTGHLLGSPTTIRSILR